MRARIANEGDGMRSLLKATEPDFGFNFTVPSRESMMKKSLLIETEAKFWDLAAHLTSQYGAPRISEQLTIYVDHDENEDYLKILLTQDFLQWSWFERKTHHPERITADIAKRRYHQTKTSLRNLKSKLIFLAKHYGMTGHISRSVVFEYKDERTGFVFELRPSTLVDRLISVIGPEGSEKKGPNFSLLESYCSELAKWTVVGGLQEKIAERRSLRAFIHNDVGGLWRIDPFVLDFCMRNGIVSVFNESPTNAELVEAKTNDYSQSEELFNRVTGLDLLSSKSNSLTQEACQDVSIIIPCYNTGASISQVLASIASQKLSSQQLSRLEVILVDDASTEPVERSVVADNYPFPVRILRLSKRCGASHARELGSIHSNGEILVFIDSDILLSEFYLADHIIRNRVIGNAVFVSFKENVPPSDARISLPAVEKGLPLSDYSNEIRTSRKITEDIIGFTDGTREQHVNILEETFYFKNFHGSRIVGVFDIGGMVIGHNFSTTRALVEKARPFSKDFRGWGMEDHFLGLKMVLAGANVIPVLCSSVYHIDHPPRSGDDAAKASEARANIDIVNRFLDSLA